MKNAIDTISHTNNDNLDSSNSVDEELKKSSDDSNDLNNILSPNIDSCQPVCSETQEIVELNISSIKNNKNCTFNDTYNYGRNFTAHNFHSDNNLDSNNQLFQIKKFISYHGDKPP